MLTLEAFALGDADAVDHLVLVEDALDGDLLLELLAGIVDLVGDAASVQLDLHDVRLLLTTPEELLLGVADEAHNLAVLLDLVEILLDLFLADIVAPLEAGLGEGLLLGLRPLRLGRKQRHT